ncbi:ribosome biogenesis GTPase YlqF [Paenactinomyces guangxiensis]|uniref:Ribosome biogenesis GTPase A n=1 Tax=Paenactinomyces guangxiensis TaxID=1490290 RepID=A0A7W1WRF3_9BACL|nr:ribosome biogenesis GTPase YlqF [Paenactinomyces guangxiensis]MBA4494709.1 ribosome biogenesis GTPase YlqF [Paenactinomyces guangxiensis]MBH8591793.1 ribosome biogenesis GTPase YlqF [Paenactinomyces guangxiensis]
MSIQWFPGHMAKARRQVEEKLKLVDIVFELLDARLPLSSRNPMIDDLVKHKPRLLLLTKCDLADERGNKAWLDFFHSQGMSALPVDAKTGKGVGQIQPASEKLLQPLFATREKKGIRSRQVRAMVLGIPNVGKSSLINRLAKRTAAVTGDRPGVTKAQQWIRIGKTMELLDTPGILWPKFDDSEVGLRLAASGAIKEEILPLEEVALYAVNYLSDRYPQFLAERYKLKDLSLSGVGLLTEIGKKRGCLQKGGEINFEKVAEILLNDLRSGRIGKVTMEMPGDWHSDGGVEADGQNDS